MKNIIKLTFSGILLLAIMESCSSQGDEMKDFAVKLGKQIAANELDSVRMVYPGAQEADSLALKFDAETIKIAASKEPGCYVITYAPGAQVEVKKDANGKITVLSSRGIFAYKPDKMDFAKKTGAYDANLNDIILAEHINDTAFIRFVNEKYKNGVEDLLSVTQSGATAMVTNNGDKQVDGNDYEVTYSQVAIGFDTETLQDVYETHGTKTSEGKTVAPGQKVGVPMLRPWVENEEWGADCTRWIYRDPRITWTIPEDVVMRKYMSPTGKEYKEYLESKAQGK